MGATVTAAEGEDAVPDASDNWVPLEGLQHQVAVEVLLRGPLSRKQLAARLGVTRGTVTRAAHPLIEAGLLVERAHVRAPGLGRPEEPLDVELTRDFFIGIKITAGHLHGVVTSLRADVLHETTVALASLRPDDVADQIAEMVGDLTTLVPWVRAIGVSLGAQVLAGSLVTQAPLLGWSGVDLGALLRARVPVPVVVDNDVLSLVRAERWFGAARDSDNFALITVGAGIGYGLVANGALIEGPDAGLNTVTHFPLDLGGSVCSEGHTGCAETLLTTQAIRGRALPTLGDVSLEELLRLVPESTAAAAIVETAAFALGKLIAAVSNLALPRKVVVTGDGVALAIVGREAMQRGIDLHRSRRATPLDLEVQVVGFSEWARGAAATAIETFVVGR